MKRWECQQCGFIYDEAEGWEEENISPGTKWEDIPEDWTCPDCGAGRSVSEHLPPVLEHLAPTLDA